MNYISEEKKKMIKKYHAKYILSGFLVVLIFGIIIILSIILFSKDMYIIVAIMMVITLIASAFIGSILDKQKDKFLAKNGITRSEYFNIINEKNEILNKFSDSQLNLNGFNPNYKVGKILEFDDLARKVAVYDVTLFSRYVKRIVKYEDIIEVSVIEDNETILTSGLGKSVVGAALFGGPGMVAGAIIGKKNKPYCDKLAIKITLNSNEPCMIITIIETRVNTHSMIYENACKLVEEAVSKFKVAMHNNKSVEKENPLSENQIPDLIKKYKKLNEEGVISDEEFSEKKKQLLNL